MPESPIMTKCSLLISTYNWPKALDFCLQSALQQTHLPGEILIADDGSTEETASLIKEYRQVSPIPIIHVWHEDKGFRLAEIRNKAIAKAQYDYIIQIDGDVIMSPYFISDHLAAAQKGYIAAGTRAMLREDVSAAILVKDKIPAIKFLKKNCAHKLNSVRNKWVFQLLRYRYKTRGKHKFYIRGCNMAYWREDALKINGYNEAITGWGSEDHEFVVRMLKLGIRKQFLKMTAIVFHIYHKPFSKSNRHKNELIKKASSENNHYYIKDGMDKYVQS